jgi:hypothetical protein
MERTMRQTPANEPPGVNQPAGRLLVFVTETGPESTSGPVLFIEERADAVLPANPRGLAWRYFATIGREDAMVAEEREAIEVGLEEDGHYISSRLISAPPVLDNVG